MAHAVLQGQRLSYCEVSGSQNEVASACSANPACKSFTTVKDRGYVGFLKKTAGPTTYTEGAVTYIKA